MQILVTFPKDKEELEKQRMAAMFKKIGGGSGSQVIQDGEQRMRQINNDLTRFMRDNKEQRKVGSPEATQRTKPDEEKQVTMPLNQLVDMYAFGNANVFGRNDSVGSLSQGSPDGPGLMPGAEVNHVARNAFVSSQYKQISGIRTQLNQDIFYTRLFNSL